VLAQSAIKAVSFRNCALFLFMEFTALADGLQEPGLS